MGNKTCGECKYFNPISGICIKLGKKPSRTMPSCPYRPTNGDKIRQMSNEELADIISNFDCKICPAMRICFNEENETCFDGMLAWLNAPADCVGKDINVRTKESEGDDE